jgi:hypothetical protein
MFVTKLLSPEQRKVNSLQTDCCLQDSDDSDDINEKHQIKPTSIDRSTFSQRVTNIDLKSCHQVANAMLSEINQYSGKNLLLLHKIIEVIRLEPRLFNELLIQEYQQQEQATIE